MCSSDDGCTGVDAKCIGHCCGFGIQKAKRSAMYDGHRLAVTWCMNNAWQRGPLWPHRMGPTSNYYTIIQYQPYRADISLFVNCLELSVCVTDLSWTEICCCCIVLGMYRLDLEPPTVCICLLNITTLLPSPLSVTSVTCFVLWPACNHHQ